MKLLLVPVSLPPVRVAVIVLPVPACVTETLSVRTPLANTADTAGLIVPAVVLRFTVLVNPVTVLLFASCAVIVMPNAVPAVCGSLIVLIANFANAPAFTSNVLLVPVSVPPVRVAVIVLPVPACVTVTFCVRTPATNDPETVGAIAPAVVLRFTVLVNAVTVLLFASCAVIVMSNAVPAVCGLLMLAIANLLSAPASTVNGALSPAVRVLPLVRVAVRTTPLSALV